MQDGDGDSEAREKFRIVRRLQNQYNGHIIRRTTMSKNWEGKTLIDLPPLITIEGYLKLSQRETDIVNALAKKAKEK